MIVQAYRNPARDVVEVRVFQPERDGGTLAMDAHRHWIRVPAGAELPVAYTLDWDVYIHLTQEGDRAGQLKRADDATEDARKVRDRLLALVELTAE